MNAATIQDRRAPKKGHRGRRDGSVVAWETWRLRQIFGADAILFIGVPTYKDEHFVFHRAAESMSSGLRSIGIGLSSSGKIPKDKLGAAVYAGSTAAPAGWSAWHRNCLTQRD